MIIEIRLNTDDVKEAVKMYMKFKGYNIVDSTYMTIIQGGRFLGVESMCFDNEKTSLQPKDS